MKYSSQQNTFDYRIHILYMATDYPSDRNTRRKHVYQRDNHTCQNCGSSGGPQGHAELHAHHVVPKSRGGTHETSNLITLCKECHNTVHSKSKQAPTSHQQPIGGGADYGNLSDAIVTDILTVSDTLADALAVAESPDVSGYEEVNELEQLAIELRPFIMQITDAIEALDSLSTSNYPRELVRHDKKFMNHATEVMLLSLEWLETRSNQLRDLFEDMYSCPECDESVDVDEQDFCPSCGTELKLGSSCPACGEDVLGMDEFCSSCGESLDDIEDPRGIGEKVVEIKNNSSKSIDEMNPKVEKLRRMFEKRNDIIEKHSQY